MEPVGLTIKHNGVDKYGRERGGDIMIVHACTGCGSVNINRIAADDCCDALLMLFKQSQTMSWEQWQRIEKTGIRLLRAEQAEQLQTALFGKTSSP